MKNYVLYRGQRLFLALHFPVPWKLPAKCHDDQVLSWLFGPLEISWVRFKDQP